MKKGLATAAIAFAALAQLAPAPARAATNYTIVGPAAVFAASTIWAGAGCRGDALPQANNVGLDSVVIDVGARSGSSYTMGIRWTSASGGGVVGLPTLAAETRDSRCRSTGTPLQSTTAGPGTWNVNIPAGTKWLLIESRLPAGVTLTIP